MGAEVTTDKHTTGIDEWLDIADKLETTNYDEPIANHLSAWKFFPDELNQQEFNTLPLLLDPPALHQTLSPHDAYLLLAITLPNPNPPSTIALPLSSLALSIRQCIDTPSYHTPIISGSIDNCQYYVYAYLGKMSKSRIRLAVLSYALKMSSLLNSKKKLAILSSGGVFKNKKLQKGSTVLLTTPNITTTGKPIDEFRDIHVFAAFSPITTPTPSYLTHFRSKRSSPFIECEDRVEERVAVGKAVGGGKPPMLKLSLKPYEETRYEQIEEEAKSGEIKFDIRATARHQLKMQRFEGECSEVVEGVFVAGEKVARSLQALQKYNIGVVVNCAGDYCENWFQGRGIRYTTFFLKDSQNENIQCLFYQVIELILTCQKSKTNILVHCIQGISRSVTFIIAFLIFKLGLDYKKAEQLLKQKRPIACPNNGFMVELIQFHKRLYDDFHALPAPRVFLLSAHSKETPHLITARMLKHPLFDPKKWVGLDSRGVYIVQSPDSIYIWVGSRCEQKRLKTYWSYAQDYVKKLQKYQKGSLKVKAISQGTQGKEFFALWNLEDVPEVYENPDYTRLFYQGEPAKPGGMRKFYEKEIEQEEHLNKLYIYPQNSSGLGVFEWEDLGNLNILVCCENEALKVFICKKEGFEDEEAVGTFLDGIIKQNYGSYEPDQIIIEEESMDAPSEGFLACFS